MSSPRLAHGSLHHHGAGLLPDDLEGVDYLLLDGGPVVAPDEEGPEEQLDEAIRRLAPTLYLDPKLKVVASLAGRRPEAAARRAAAILSESGNADLLMGVVRGGDVLDRLEEFLVAGETLRDSTTGQVFIRTTTPPRAAALGFDGEPIAAAAQQGARLVLLAHADLETIQLQLLGELRGPGAATPLEMKLETGMTARLLLQPADGGGDGQIEELGRRWRERLESAGLSSDAAFFRPAMSAGADKLDLALAAYRDTEASIAVDGIRCLQQLCCDAKEGRPAFDVILGPVCKRDYTTRHTSIPTDLVEWSVDVRAARDWVE